MIDSGAFRALVETYRKHGWMLRRVLLSSAGKRSLEENVIEFSVSIPIVDSEMDAAWFSRPPAERGVAWELRYLGDVPYALVENIDEKSADFEAKITAVESKLIGAIQKRQTP